VATSEQAAIVVRRWNPADEHNPQATIQLRRLLG
jgi:hypothetical protein